VTTTLNPFQLWPPVGLPARKRSPEMKSLQIKIIAGIEVIACGILAGSIVACTSTYSQIRLATLPASQGYHEDPLHFEQWTYRYSTERSHCLTYRWHVGSGVHVMQVSVLRSGCQLIDVREVCAATGGSEVAVRPRIRGGMIVAFIRRSEPNSEWITTHDRMQVSPPISDAIDDILEQGVSRHRKQGEQVMHVNRP
jgi:hypothetical protein